MILFSLHKNGSKFILEGRGLFLFLFVITLCKLIILYCLVRKEKSHLHNDAPCVAPRNFLIVPFVQQPTEECANSSFFRKQTANFSFFLQKQTANSSVSCRRPKNVDSQTAFSGNSFAITALHCVNCGRIRLDRPQRDDIIQLAGWARAAENSR